MNKDEMEKMLRPYVIDTLIAQSGKVLTPELIGQLTSEILERIYDEWVRNDIN